jgi:hypothetical protein
MRTSTMQDVRYVRKVIVGVAKSVYIIILKVVASIVLIVPNLGML